MHDGAVPLRVAYTLEQCWHDVPGGTARAALEVGRRLDESTEVELVGVAGRHRRPPARDYRPTVPITALPVARPWLYETWNRFGWPRVEAATGPIDVCHSTLAIPAATGAAHVVTVHDVAFVASPERFTRHGARVMRSGLDRCRDADLVLCPSTATIDRLVDLAFDPGRLRHVPWGVTPVEVSDRDRARVVDAYRLPDRFVLFVGTIEPRKNLARLALATARLPMPLVVVGPAGWGEMSPVPGDVRFLGHVAALDLPAIYAVAAVMAYPSLEEGFGMPVLEAMAQGAPVVTSRGTATEEVADGAAVLVNATDEASIVAGLAAAIDDASRLSAAGRERAAIMTWDAAVERTIEAYREAAP